MLQGNEFTWSVINNKNWLESNQIMNLGISYSLLKLLLSDLMCFFFCTNFSQRLPGWRHSRHRPNRGRMCSGWFGAHRAGCLLGWQAQVAPERIPVYVNDRGHRTLPLNSITPLPGPRKFSSVNRAIPLYVSRPRYQVSGSVRGCDNMRIFQGVLICSQFH